MTITGSPAIKTIELIGQISLLVESFARTIFVLKISNYKNQIQGTILSMSHSNYR